MPKDKSGKDISWNEFFKRWGNGIKQVATAPTPLEKTSIEYRATLITLVGLITCLITLIIFRDKFFVNWFTYGLILIFTGNILSTGLKFFGLREQRKFLKSLEIDSDSPDSQEEYLLLSDKTPLVDDNKEDVKGGQDGHK